MAGTVNGRRRHRPVLAQWRLRHNIEQAGSTTCSWASMRRSPSS